MDNIKNRYLFTSCKKKYEKTKTQSSSLTETGIDSYSIH